MVVLDGVALSQTSLIVQIPEKSESYTRARAQAQVT